MITYSSSDKNRVGRVENLKHAGMITSVVPRPWGTILHHPSFFWFLCSLWHQCINPYFELFILSLQYITSIHLGLIWLLGNCWKNFIQRNICFWSVCLLSWLCDPLQKWAEPCLSSSQSSDWSRTQGPWAQCYTSCKMEPIFLQTQQFLLMNRKVAWMHHHLIRSSSLYRQGNRQTRWKELCLLLWLVVPWGGQLYWHRNQLGLICLVLPHAQTSRTGGLSMFPGWWGTI